MKKHFLRNVIDTIRSANQEQSSSSNLVHSNVAVEYGNQLKSSHFSLAQVARHGFPDSPTALAYDPVQKLAAIGTKSGSLRIFGRPGVDLWAQHKPEFAVTHIKFIINQGAIITITSDESIHLWSLVGPSLKLQFSAQSVNASNTSGSSSGPSPTNMGAQTHGSEFGSSSQVNDSKFLSDSHHNISKTSPSPLGESPKQPEILHTLKFQREHITCLHQTLGSKWLYIGTERGNVHVANVETFELSGYSIAWNKAIELSRKTHPGSIIHLSECPQGTNKLLIGFESGCIVLWDLKNKNAEGRYYYTENLLWLAWHYEGKQFIAAHGDGSLVTWQTRSNARPVSIIHPHAKTGPPSASTDPNTQDPVHSLTSSFARALNNELYQPINKVDWKTTKSNEQFLLFSGGLPYDNSAIQSTSTPTSDHGSSQGATNSIKASSTLSPNQHSTTSAGAVSPISPSKSPSIDRSSAGSRQSNYQALQSQRDRKNLRSTSLTVMHGKSITVLEMDETIVDFITICENSPYENDAIDPSAIIVLLTNDLILIDLTSPGYPSFDSPYPSSQLNESPVTCIQYIADCNIDLIPSLYSSSQNVVTRAPKKGFSDKEWPINGGEWGQQMQSYPELVITGHADGTLKFWDISGVNFDLISKVKTSKLFERPNVLPNSVIIWPNRNLNQGRQSASSPMRPSTSPSTSLDYLQHSEQQIDPQADENYLAIEKIEYYPATKNLVVAGAMSQVIQFRLIKKDTTSSGDQTVIQVEPIVSSLQDNGSQGQKAPQYHSLLKPRTNQSSSSSVSGQPRSSSSNRPTGFQVELMCLTSMYVSQVNYGAVGSSGCLSTNEEAISKISHYCHAPPKVTAIALHTSLNM